MSVQKPHGLLYIVPMYANPMIICLDQRTGGGCGNENRSEAVVCGQCGRSLRYALRFHDAGALIGAYQIDQVIGHGNFGAVYLAQHRNQPTQKVALKETFDPNSIRSFEGEFAVLNGLLHPNLPQYHEMFVVEDNGYLVMEFVPGQSLEQILQRQNRPLPESQVLGYAVQLCDLLAYLHRQDHPIIHRDIKPANIRLTPDGLIKLVDFGIAKQGTGATSRSRRALTPAYAPLEQYGHGQHTDPRSDIYSLGATLYHLLSNQEPSSAADRIASSTDPLPPLASLAPSVSRHVAAAISQALAMTPDARPSDALTLKRVLLSAQTPERPAAPQFIVAAPSQPVAAPRLAAAAAGIANTSGTGKRAMVPPEIRSGLNCRTRPARKG